MKLRALDQIHISAVKSDILRPREEFDVSDSHGAELLKKHPGTLEDIDAANTKAEKAPKNKAAPKPANKSA